MDPLAIFKILWTYKWITIPFIVLIVVGCGAAFVYGPRSYDSTSSYVVISPGAPTEESLEKDASLAQKSNNPYLRSEPSLAAQVVATRLGAGDIGEMLKAEGLSTTYVVTTATEVQTNQVIRITASADTPEKAVATSKRLGEVLSEQLVVMQSGGGADSSFLLVAQPVGPPGAAVEKKSSRLRTVVVLGIAGIVLMFGAVSLARAVQNHRSKSSTAGGDSTTGEPDGADASITDADPTAAAHSPPTTTNRVTSSEVPAGVEDEPDDVDRVDMRKGLWERNLR